MEQRRRTKDQSATVHELVSLKTIAQLADADRSTVRRWLSHAGIQPMALGRGRNGAIRYRWQEVKHWLDSLEPAGWTP